MTGEKAPFGAQGDDVLVALGLVCERVGALGMEIAYLHDGVPMEEAGWYASAHLRGTRIIAENMVGPIEAAEELIFQILQGGQCFGCRKVAVVDFTRKVPTQHFGDRTHDPAWEPSRADVCELTRDGKVFMRECGMEAPADSTRERLAQALIDAGFVHAAMIGAARSGLYDDFLSDEAMPLHLLVGHLQQYGDKALPLRQRVMEGEFDSTKEEADAWAASEDGKAAFDELLGAGMVNKIKSDAQKLQDSASRRSAERGRRGKRRKK